MPIAYAPRAPHDPSLPWLLDLDPATGQVTAYRADAPLLHRRDRSDTTVHPSLIDACAPLDPAALELRHWLGVSLADVVRAEVARFGRYDVGAGGLRGWSCGRCTRTDTATRTTG